MTEESKIDLPDECTEMTCKDTEVDGSGKTRWVGSDYQVTAGIVAGGLMVAGGLIGGGIYLYNRNQAGAGGNAAMGAPEQVPVQQVPVQQVPVQQPAPVQNNVADDNPFQRELLEKRRQILHLDHD